MFDAIYGNMWLVQLKPEDKLESEFIIKIVGDVFPHDENYYKVPEDVDCISRSYARLDCIRGKSLENEKHCTEGYTEWVVRLDEGVDSYEQAAALINEAFYFAESHYAYTIAVPLRPANKKIDKNGLGEMLQWAGVKYAADHPECHVYFYLDYGADSQKKIDELKKVIGGRYIIHTEKDEELRLGKILKFFLEDEADQYLTPDGRVKKNKKTSIPAGQEKDQKVIQESEPDSKEEADAVTKDEASQDYDSTLSLNDFIRKYKGEEFPKYMMEMVSRKSSKSSEIYKKAGVSKQAFSRLKKEGEIEGSQSLRSRKYTVILLALGLGLPYNESLNFISMAGFALSDSSEVDLVIRWHILNGKYSLDAINEALYERNLGTLGNVEE